MSVSYYGNNVHRAIFVPSPNDRFMKPPIDELFHYGKPHVGSTSHSGRYPFGSGNKPYQHEEFFEGFGKDANVIYKKYDGKFNDCIKDMLNQGMTKRQIADSLGISVKQLDARCSMTAQQFMAYRRAEAFKIINANPTMSNTEIAKILGCTEGNIRAYKREGPEYIERADSVMKLVDELKARVDEKGYVDVSEGNEYWINATKSKLDTAAAILKEQGYELENIGVKQVFGEGWTTTSVLAKPGTTKDDIVKNMDKIVPVFDPEIDENATTLGLKYRPESLDPSRIGVRYAEDGGADRDGLIELRRGVEDLSLGDSHYAQVRIGVNDSHYIKGIASYSNNFDEFPDGVDVIVNSNKSRGTPLFDSDPDAKQVLKPMKLGEDGEVDWNNPFGASIKQEGGQSTYLDKNGVERVSPINKIGEEGDWAQWNKTVAAQMLSKQPVTVAVDQLKLATDIRKSELENIMTVENPVIRKKLLNDYADACDTAATDLKAAAFPGQQSHIIMPLTSIKSDEIYAPNYADGSKVILIRYPHASTHEIPYLTVNNKNAEGDDLIGKNAKDAVGIHPKTAAQLSGADFDGDTVLVIPANGKDFVHKSPIKDLVEFDPKKSYPNYDGMYEMTKKDRGREMGYVTNLIQDMHIKGANGDVPTDDLVKAIKHSMVVIDAYKHKLDYKKSYVDNDIAELNKKYLGHAKPGGSTLITRAGGNREVPERKEGAYITDPKTGKTIFAKIDPTTGEKLYTETGRTKTTGGYYNKNGKWVPEKTVLVKEKVNKMAYEKDARKLSTGTPMEEAYATYANHCKSLANKARKAMLGVDDRVTVNPTAAKAYSKEVDSIKGKILTAQKHAPLERQATIFAGCVIRSKLKENPTIKDDEDSFKKLKSQALNGARNRFGGGRKKLTLTDKEWEAVNAGAVNKTMVQNVARYMDSKDLKRYSIPRVTKTISPTMRSLIESMKGRDYTNKEIAQFLNISVSTVQSVSAE